MAFLCIFPLLSAVLSLQKKNHLLAFLSHMKRYVM